MANVAIYIFFLAEMIKTSHSNTAQLDGTLLLCSKSRSAISPQRAPKFTPSVGGLCSRDGLELPGRSGWHQGM